jgi:thiosulfate/3-mercaptopyruvate sulfurtransferase
VAGRRASSLVSTGTSVWEVIAPFVDAAWLAAHRAEVVLADVRWYLDGRSGAAAFAEGHLLGAVFVDLDRWLAAPADPRHGRHPLPDPEVFAQGMREAGVGDDATVVAYDDAGGLSGARLVWLLRATGHAAALLDGGLAAAGGPLEAGPVVPAPAPFTARPWPAERLAGIDELGSGVLLDARTRNRYAGDFEPVDPRPGHIPGARNLPAAEMLGPDTRLLPVAELRGQVRAAGVGEDDAVIASCGSGVNACHTLLVLEALGLPPGRLYPGSYSQWSNTDRPVESGR